LAAVSCESSDENPPIDTGKDYFPLQKGAFQIYDVTSIKYTLGVPETLRYELKTVVTDSFPNAEGGHNFIIYRSQRNEAASGFTYLDTWSARIDMREAVTHEENIPFLKIKLPVVSRNQWDGNLYNSAGEDLYTLEEVKVPYSTGGQSYDDCIIINQNNNEDFVVALDQRKEVYAKNIGLIYKEVRQLQYCTVGSCLGKQQVESGIIYTQTLKSHGVE
jgi:hypothetical protein